MREERHTSLHSHIQKFNVYLLTGQIKCHVQQEKWALRNKHSFVVDSACTLYQIFNEALPYFTGCFSKRVARHTPIAPALDHHSICMEENCEMLLVKVIRLFKYKHHSVLNTCRNDCLLLFNWKIVLLQILLTTQKHLEAMKH